jgi:23S rRNA-/tRNA-specific pseudouridylate synthase
MPAQEETAQARPPGKRPATLADRYRRLDSWASKAAVTEHLFSSVVYHEPEKDGLVVVNKPYGLPLLPKDDSSYCLTDCLSGLAEMLEVKTLDVLRTSERWNSGITVLATTEKAKEAYMKSVGRMQASRTLASSYLCVVKGHTSLSRTETLDARLVDCPHVTNPVMGKMHKELELSRKLVSRHMAKRDNVKQVHVRCTTLANSSRLSVGLAEVQPSSSGNNFLQVYLADAGCPVLGDSMYDYRSRSMLGHKVRLTTAHTVARRSEVLAPALLEALGLRKGEEWEVPRLVHQHRLHLQGWHDRETDLTVFAPPPPHFQQTCTELGIGLDYKAIAERDAVHFWNHNARKKKKKAVAAT